MTPPRTWRLACAPCDDRVTVSAPDDRGTAPQLVELFHAEHADCPTGGGDQLAIRLAAQGDVPEPLF